MSGTDESASPAITPFRVSVSSSAIQDINTRLAATRWPDAPPGAEWTYGADRDWVRALCAHWRDRFDWAAFTDRLNAFPQFTTRSAGQSIHFYHVRSPHPQARPLLLCHGWPSSPAEYLDIFSALTDPCAVGGDARDAFHVVAPSLPGFGFSGPTLTMGVNSRASADSFAEIMVMLGYDQFLAHGSDKGVLTTMALAERHPGRVLAMHLTLVPGIADDAALSSTEQVFQDKAAAFQTHSSGYQAIQRTMPQSLAYGLMDSPAALAAWIGEKHRNWSETEPPPARLLETIAIYWLTGTIASSMRLYFEDHTPGRSLPLPAVTVPTGHSHFPGELYHTPRRWAERRFPIHYWNEVPRGGHFPAAEVPDLFVEELRAFARAVPI